MNILAHAFLSPDDPAVFTGNVVADWIKGKIRFTLPAQIQVGMSLHRRIDAFTDTHFAVARVGDLLAERWGRYASVLTDIFFDHLLAADWQTYSDTPLPAFAARTYATISDYRHLLPERCNMAIAAMTADDWLGSYATLDGIRMALSRMSLRLRHGLELAPAVEDFIEHRAAFHAAFQEFFPQLRHCAATTIVEAGTFQT